jgi:hypothetical protein
VFYIYFYKYLRHIDISCRVRAIEMGNIAEKVKDKVMGAKDKDMRPI